MSASEVFSPAEDQAAFAEVYRAHHHKLLRYCEYRLRDRHEAEDVVQEAFARAWRSMPTTAFDRNFYPWLRVVAANLCTDVLRKRSRSEPVAVIDRSVVDQDLDRLTEEADRVMVRQALDRLNDRHRSALIMRESEGLTYDQIAERTGVTSGTVESLLWRARQALKREFTVIAGREGCVAVVPVLVAALVRGRAAGRRAWLRVARRIPGLDPSSETSLAHAAMAAVAALTVATGVVATLGFGAGHHRPPAVVLQDRNAATTIPASSAATSIARTGPPATTAPAAGPSSAGPNATPLAPGLSTGPVASTPAAVPLRVVDPIVVGRSAAPYAANAPVTVHAGQVAVGVSPPVVLGYVQSTTNQVKAVVPAASNLNPLQEKTP
jgi:RNA polymerase sigma-70 factor (ECF subfamily)